MEQRWYVFHVFRFFFRSWCSLLFLPSPSFSITCSLAIFRKKWRCIYKQDEEMNRTLGIFAIVVSLTGWEKRTSLRVQMEKSYYGCILKALFKYFYRQFFSKWYIKMYLFISEIYLRVCNIIHRDALVAYNEIIPSNLLNIFLFHSFCYSSISILQKKLSFCEI